MKGELEYLTPVYCSQAFAMQWLDTTPRIPYHCDDHVLECRAAIFCTRGLLTLISLAYLRRCYIVHDAP